MFRKLLNIGCLVCMCFVFTGCGQVHLEIRCKYESGLGSADPRAEDWWPSMGWIYVQKSDEYRYRSFDLRPDYKNHLATAGINFGKYYDSEWYYHDDKQEYDCPPLDLRPRGSYSILPVGGVW